MKDLKAMLQHDDPEGPETKGNKADLRDRVQALVNVNQAATKFAAVAADRATLAPAVPAETMQTPCTTASDTSAAIHSAMAPIDG
jgi:hypothetical protein